MDPYDKEKTREIWKRVLGEEESCDCRAFDSELLREMIAEEKTSACAYRALARCAGGQSREQLCRFAEQALCHARKLDAIYYLWTGERACVTSGEVPRFRCLPEGLREMHGRETVSAARCHRTAEELPDHAEVFHAAAREKTCRAEALLRLLQCCLAM